MKIAIIGGGASGVLAAILIKKENIDHDVYIFEHENKLLKKLLSTGNGRCNLGNAKIDINKYRNKDVAKNILKGYNVKQTFSSLGIEIKNIDNLYYPYSESSQSVYNVLIDNLEKEHVKIHLEENIIDYKSQNDKIELLTNKNKYEFDRLLIAIGGVSYPKLGSDGSFIDIIKKHNYKFDEFNGVYREFGVSKNELLKKLRSLHSDTNRVLTAELNMGLDHITIKSNLTAIDALEQLAL